MSEHASKTQGIPTPEQTAKGRGVVIERPTSEEALAWLKEQVANAPERDEQWYREVLDIYRAGRREVAEAVAEQLPKRVA